MLHTILPTAEMALFPKEGLCLAAINHACSPDSVNVSLCGPAASIGKWLIKDKDAVRLRPEHPWHHPDYKSSAGLQSMLSEMSSTQEDQSPGPDHGLASVSCRFVSATAATDLTRLDVNHWKTWLTSPVNFLGALDHIGNLVNESDKLVAIIEMGPHPVFTAASAALTSKGAMVKAHIVSMKRGEGGRGFLQGQRDLLEGHRTSFETNDALSAIRSHITSAVE